MNEEILAKAKQTKSPEELLALAAENGYTLDEETAKEFFEKLQSLDELSEDELDHISGGSYGKSREIHNMKKAVKKYNFNLEEAGNHYKSYRSNGLPAGRPESLGLRLS